MKLDELVRLAKIKPEEILRRRVEPIGTELVVVRDAIAGIKKLELRERDVLMSGLERHTKLICAIVAEFKHKIRRNVSPFPWAKAGEISVGPIRPETFGLDTFKRTGLTVGTYHIVPTAAGTWKPTKDEEILIITDLIEINPDNVVTAVQVADVDGDVLNSEDISKDIRASDLQHHEFAYPIVCNTSLDIDGKVEFAGDAEIVPVGLHVALGTQIPDLT